MLQGITKQDVRMNEQNEIVRSDLNDLLVELESRTKAVNDTLAANLSDPAYLQALRGVQNTATRLVEINRAGQGATSSSLSS